MTSFATRLEVEAQIEFALIFMDVSKVGLCCSVYLFCVGFFACLIDLALEIQGLLWATLWIK